MSDMKLETGKRMLELRKKQSKNQSDVAAYLGLTVAAYQNYETGRREAGYETLCKLADYFNTTTDYLLGRAPQTNPLAMLDLQVDIHEDAVMEQYMQLPKEWRRILLDVMKKLGDAAERGERGEPIRQAHTIILKCFRDAASAGTGEMLCRSDTDDVTVIATPEAENADFLVRVSGDSMEPTFSDGDLLLCKSAVDLEYGEIGVFRHECTGYVKEYSKAGLISHNPAYALIPKAKLNGMEISGKVLGVAQLPE